MIKRNDVLPKPFNAELEVLEELIDRAIREQFGDARGITVDVSRFKEESIEEIAEEYQKNGWHAKRVMNYEKQKFTLILS